METSNDFHLPKPSSPLFETMDNPNTSELPPTAEKRETFSPDRHATEHCTVETDRDEFCAKGREWAPVKERIILGPYEYILQQPGKDIRKQFIQAFNRWLRVPEQSSAIIEKIIVMLHTASLLVDDVQDSSILRRGIPVANNIFGISQTINSANYVYFLALEEARKLNNVAAIDVFIRELMNLHRGQGMDLFWRDTLTCPTEDDYLEMVGNKTAGLFRLAVKLMQAESQIDIDCTALVNLLGAIFQICDDYLNLSHATYRQNKGLCEDLTEGKFSFPIIHSIRTRPDDLQLINLLKQKPTADEVKLYAVKYMESTGSFAYTRGVISQLHAKALHLIDEIEWKVKTDGEGSAGKSGGFMVREILNRIVEPTTEHSNGQGDSK